MTIHLSIMLWLPAAAGLVALLLPGRARWIGLAGAAGALAYGDRAAGRLRHRAGRPQYVTDETWISTLGIHYKLAITGSTSCSC